LQAPAGTSPEIAGEESLPALLVNSQFSSSLFGPASPSSASGGLAGISIISTASAPLPPGSFPDFAMLPSAAPPLTQEKKEVLPARPTITNDSADIGARSKNILMNALKVRPVEGAPTIPHSIAIPAALPPTDPVFPPQVQIHQDLGPNFSQLTSSRDDSIPVIVSMSVTASEFKSDLEREQDTTFTQLCPPPHLFDGASHSAAVSMRADEDDWDHAAQTISQSHQKIDNASLEDRQSDFMPPPDSLRTIEKRLADIESSLKQFSEKSHTRARGDITPKHLSDLKASLVQDVTKVLEKILMGTLKTAVEEQSQQAVARILGSDSWREEVAFRKHSIDFVLTPP
jgi:hypothetical protein